MPTNCVSIGSSSPVSALFVPGLSPAFSSGDPLPAGSSPENMASQSPASVFAAGAGASPAGTAAALAPTGAPGRDPVDSVPKSNVDSLFTWLACGLSNTELKSSSPDFEILAKSSSAEPSFASSSPSKSSSRSSSKGVLSAAGAGAGGWLAGAAVGVERAEPKMSSALLDLLGLC